MLIIATGHLVGLVKSVRTDKQFSDWDGAVNLVVKEHGVDKDWIAQVHLISNDFLIKAMYAPMYDAVPVDLVEDVSKFAELEI